MSLDNIQLSPVTLQALYKDHLVQLNDEAPAAKEKKGEIAKLGNNNKGIIIVIDNAEVAYLPEEELNFLMSVLGACNLSMNDVGIINIQKTKDISYTAITEALKAEKILMFGVTPDQLQLPLGIPYYQIQRYNNQLYVTAPSLGFIKADVEEKKLLWNCLKKTFGI